MARPRSFQIAQALQFVILVDHRQRDWASQRRTVPDAGLDVDFVGLDSLSSSTPIASLATPELDVDRVGFQRDPGRKTVDQGDQRLAMRFAGGPVT